MKHIFWTSLQWCVPLLWWSTRWSIFGKESLCLQCHPKVRFIFLVIRKCPSTKYLDQPLSSQGTQCSGNKAIVSAYYLIKDVVFNLSGNQVEDIILVRIQGLFPSTHQAVWTGCTRTYPQGHYKGIIHRQEKWEEYYTMTRPLKYSSL